MAINIDDIIPGPSAPRRWRWLGWKLGVSGRVIKECDRIPVGYGIGWLRWDRDEAVCFPIPFHWIFGGARAAYIWAIHSYFKDREIRAFEKGFKKGLESGRLMDSSTVRSATQESARKAFESGWNSAVQELAPKIEETRKEIAALRSKCVNLN